MVLSRVYRGSNHSVSSRLGVACLSPGIDYFQKQKPESSKEGGEKGKKITAVVQTASTPLGIKDTVTNTGGGRKSLSTLPHI